MNSDQQNSKVCDNFRGVRAGPRRRDELGPGEIKIVKFSEGSELVPGGGMNSDQRKTKKNVKIWEKPELVPNLGEVQAGPRRDRISLYLKK